jgi:hypothetical protein
MRDVFAHAERLADAVMYEGYILYPYRASAMKNRFRWQFGVIAPRSLSDTNGGDSWYVQTECLVEPADTTLLTVKARCLHLQRRQVEVHTEAHWRPCERVIANGREFLTWDEAVPGAVASPPLSVDALCRHEHAVAFDLPGAIERETVDAAAAESPVRITRRRWSVAAVVRIRAEYIAGVVKIRVRVENRTVADSQASGRAVALRHSLLGCHLLLHVDNGQFVPMLDPPPHAEAAARSCVSERAWPVLVGPPGRRDVTLASPIILPDYPAIAPETPHAFFDATEIDELLALRVMTMTDQERSEAAATDRHAGAIIDSVERHTANSFAELHGAVRSFEELLNGGDSPERAFVDVGCARLASGSRVRLRPRRRSDSLDLFLAGRTATIAMVHRDLEDRVHLAVTLDDDPGADLKRAYGRFFYFSPDEVCPIEAEAGDARR